MSAAWSNTRKNRSNALPAADAHRHQRRAVLNALQFMQGLDGDQGAGRANRMAQRNTRAVGVDHGRVQPQVAADRAGLGGKGFVGFDDVQIVHREARFFSAIWVAGTGPIPMYFGSTPACA